MLLSLLGLALLIVIHELGHFLVARWCGLAVPVFSLGFGKALLQRRWGDTDYVLGTLPFGGYVVIKGMVRAEDIAPDDRTAFCNRSVPVRSAAIAAGPAINYILGFTMLATLFFAGAPVPTERAFIGTPDPGKPAALAGLQPGDLIETVDGKNVADSWVDMVSLIRASGGAPLQLQVLRGGQQISSVIHPVLGTDKKTWVIGVPAGAEPHPNATLGQAAAFAFNRCNRQVVGLTSALWQVVTFHGTGGLEGPVGSIKEGRASSSRGLLGIVLFLADLNISLAIFNMMPWPVLDGGRLLVLAVEAITGRAPSPRAEVIVSVVGFAFLAVLMIVVTIHDVMR